MNEHTIQPTQRLLVCGDLWMYHAAACPSHTLILLHCLLVPVWLGLALPAVCSVPQLDSYLAHIVSCLAHQPDVLEVEINEDAEWRPAGSNAPFR
jgi:hypothetical protein